MKYIIYFLILGIGFLLGPSEFGPALRNGFSWLEVAYWILFGIIATFVIGFNIIIGLFATQLKTASEKGALMFVSTFFSGAAGLLIAGTTIIQLLILRHIQSAIPLDAHSLGDLSIGTFLWFAVSLYLSTSFTITINAKRRR